MSAERLSHKATTNARDDSIIRTPYYEGNIAKVL